ncbi:hypothetical protein GQ457_09G005190 [Hibiscus cannabinus]
MCSVAYSMDKESQRQSFVCGPQRGHEGEGIVVHTTALRALKVYESTTSDADGFTESRASFSVPEEVTRVKGVGDVV